jgi:hypothetical protein
MAHSGLTDAIAANHEWLSNIRLTDRIEWVWIGVPAGLSVIVLASLLAFTTQPPVYPMIGSAAHLCCCGCLYFAAGRHWLPLFALLLFISEINLLIFSSSAGPQLSSVLLIYGVIAICAVLLAVVLFRRTLDRLAELDGDSVKDDFRWLVTSAPLVLRRRARAIVLRLSGELL